VSRRSRCSRRSVQRRMGTSAALVIALVTMWPPAATAAASDRHITFAPVVGARWFEGDLDLETDIAFGARLGMELSPRWGMFFDFVASHPVRTSTGREVVIDAMRVLARANLMTGRTRPYLQAGVGGGMFLYPDAPNTAEGMLTVGAGVDRRIGGSITLFLEASADAFRSETVVYTPTGGEFLVEPRQTYTLGTLGMGLSFEF
jgi:hypothetical protein